MHTQVKITPVKAVIVGHAFCGMAPSGFGGRLMRNSACVENSAQCPKGGKRNYPYLLIVLIALAVPQVLRADAPPHGLLGRWRSTQTSKGGLGLMLFFRADGTFDFCPGAVVELPYRIESDEIVFPPASTDGPEQRMKLQFTGQDQLKLLDGPGPGEQLTRKGAAPDPKVPILGEWEGKRDMGGHQVEVHYLFYPNGKCLLLIAFAKRTLKYTIEGRNIRMEWPHEEPVFGKFRIKDGVLTIPGPSGKGNDYSRY